MSGQPSGRGCRRRRKLSASRQKLSVGPEQMPAAAAVQAIYRKNIHKNQIAAILRKVGT
jgi:hypothetical protein